MYVFIRKETKEAIKANYINFIIAKWGELNKKSSALDKVIIRHFMPFWTIKYLIFISISYKDNY